MNDKKILLIIVSLTILGLLGFVFWQTKPKPGTQIADLGRGHVPIGTEVKYNSNPPTSGPHYEEWAKAGVYDAPKDDRSLLHSLEHGYVIISYNCDFKQSSLFIKPALAQNNVASSSAEASSSANLPESFKSSQCQDLVKNLTDIYEKKGKHKLVIIPRPNLDAKIALTAWRYIDKFNNFDKSRIEKFIDGHRDQGPERTFEP